MAFLSGMKPTKISIVFTFLAFLTFLGGSSKVRLLPVNRSTCRSVHPISWLVITSSTTLAFLVFGGGGGGREMWISTSHWAQHHPHIQLKCNFSYRDDGIVAFVVVVVALFLGSFFLYLCILNAFRCIYLRQLKYLCNIIQNIRASLVILRYIA